MLPNGSGVRARSILAEWYERDRLRTAALEYYGKALDLRVRVDWSEVDGLAEATELPNAQRNFDTGDLVASLFYAMNVSEGINTMSEIYAVYSRAAGASERLFEILDTEPEVQEAPDAVTMRLPLGEYAASAMLPSCPFNCISFSPVVASQIRAVLSFDAVTIRLPSGEYAASVTSSSWPSPS